MSRTAAPLACSIPTLPFCCAESVLGASAARAARRSCSCRHQNVRRVRLILQNDIRRFGEAALFGGFFHFKPGYVAAYSASASERSASRCSHASCFLNTSQSPMIPTIAATKSAILIGPAIYLMECPKKNPPAPNNSAHTTPPAVFQIKKWCAEYLLAPASTAT